ncbi:hypothetical protein RCL1_004104 [Eukaryota sp. TZLM3-RCL]
MGTVVRLGRSKSTPVEKEVKRIEDTIPDLPENQPLRDFLKLAPAGALPVAPRNLEVAQCYRCKQFGHRSGSRDCPLFHSGNTEHEQKLIKLEDPMAHLSKPKETIPTERQDELEKLRDFISKEVVEMRRDRNTNQKDYKRESRDDYKRGSRDDEYRYRDDDTHYRKHYSRPHREYQDDREYSRKRRSGSPRRFTYRDDDRDDLRRSDYSRERYSSSRDISSRDSSSRRSDRRGGH